MGVTLDAAALATAIGTDTLTATRLLPVVTEACNEYAGLAPDPTANEAAIRMAGWLYAHPPGRTHRESSRRRAGAIQRRFDAVSAPIQWCDGAAIAVQRPARGGALMGLFDMFTRKRESTSYTDAVIAGLVSAAEGSNASPESVAATETSAGTWARALMAARVRPAGAVADVLTPELLGQIGRALVRRGEWVAVIDVDRDGAIALMPASSWDIDGNPEPSSWLYRCTLGAPSGTRTVHGASRRASCISSTASSRRDRGAGLSPLAFAVATARLSGGLEKAVWRTRQRYYRLRHSDAPGRRRGEP